MPSSRGQLVASGPDASAFARHKVFFIAIGQETNRGWVITPYPRRTYYR